MRGEAFALISASALRHNYRRLCALAAPARVIAVVKADGYGHGYAHVAPVLRDAGAELFAVARLSEAIALRGVLGDADILILGHTLPCHAPLLAAHNLIQAVGSLDYALALSENADHPLRIHLKLDCGMSRLGLRIASPDALREAAAILAAPRLRAEGIFSHLPSADDPRELSTHRHAAAARRFAAEIASGLPFHLHASAGILRFGGGGDAYVRAGMLLYGYAPSSALSAEGFLPAMRLYAPVLDVRTLAAGDSVSYGGAFIAPCEMRAATLGIGYGDGFPRACGRGALCIGGLDAPILGRVCMDMTVCRIPSGADLKIGDSALIFGEDGATLPSLAKAAGTIPYELLSAITARVPRILVE